MFQTFMPVQGEGGAPVSMSDTFSKLIVCLTAAARPARPSILCFFDPFVEVAPLIHQMSHATHGLVKPSGLPVQEVSPGHRFCVFLNQARQWLVSLAVCSQVPLRCVKTAFVTQGLGNRELVKNFCVPSLGHIREASARPCGQPHWSTRCLTLLMDWVMSNNPKVIRTFDACSRHSCRYREKGVPQFRCQTLSANWSYAWPPQPGHRFCVFVEDSRCWSGSTQRAAGARGFANQTLMTCESGSL